MEWSGGEGVHHAMDCTGDPDARVAAVRSTRTWGRTALVGEGDTVTVDVSNHLLRRQLTLVGSWTFSRAGQAECARFVAEHAVPVERLFTHRWQLAQAEQAYRLFDGQAAGKGVFLP